MRSEYLLGMLLWAGIDQVRDLILWIRDIISNVLFTNIRLSKHQTHLLKSYMKSRFMKLIYTPSFRLRRLSNEDDKYSLGPDTYYGSWIFHRGCIFKISDFTFNESKDLTYVSSTITMLGFRGNLDLISHMLNVGEKLLNRKRKRSLEVYALYTYKDGLAWSRGYDSECSKQGRSIESVILPTCVEFPQYTESEALLEDAKEFLSSETWYAERGIPFRRGYLLHGIPGGGKTSLVIAVASELSLPIYSLSLSSSLLSDEVLVRLLQEISHTKCASSISSSNG